MRLLLGAVAGALLLTSSDAAVRCRGMRAGARARAVRLPTRRARNCLARSAAVAAGIGRARRLARALADADACFSPLVFHTLRRALAPRAVRAGDGGATPRAGAGGDVYGGGARVAGRCAQPRAAQPRALNGCKARVCAHAAWYRARPNAAAARAAPRRGAGNSGVKSMEAASDQMGIGNPLLLGTPSSGPSAPGSASGGAVNWNGLSLSQSQPPGMHPWPAGPGGDVGWAGGYKYAAGPPNWAQPDGGDGGGSGSDDANPQAFYNPNGAAPVRFAYPGAVWVPSMAENTGAVIVSGSDTVGVPPGPPKPPAPAFVVVDTSTVVARASPPPALLGISRATPTAVLSTGASTMGRFNSFLTGRKLQQEAEA
jgi:hypothetical protein